MEGTQLATSDLGQVTLESIEKVGDALMISEKVDKRNVGKGLEMGEPHLQLLSSFLAEADIEESLVAESVTGDGTHADLSLVCNDASESLKQDVQIEGITNQTNCSNCNALLEPSKLLNETTTCKVFHVTLKRFSTETMKIWDVFKVLCHIQTDDNGRNDFTNGLAMCVKCIDILTRLFELYNEFLSISVKSSSILSRYTVNMVNTLQSEFYFIPKNSNNKKVGKKDSNSSNSQRKLPGLVPNQGEKNTIKNVAVRENSGISVKTRNMTVRQKGLPTTRSKISLKKANELSPSDGTSQTKLPLREETSTSSNFPQSFDSLDPFIKMDSNDKIPDATSDTCNRCGKTFKTFGGLKIHYASHVRDDNKVACKECGKRFNKPDALEMHVRIDHKGFKPHRCPHAGCERSFRLKDKLRLHIRDIHEKRKPFPCPKCEKSFRTKYHLKAHDVAQHVQGDTSIGCGKCRRKFPSKDALEIHMKAHEEEKRFVCSKCQKGFKTSSRLKLHSKSHDAVPSAVCATCGKAYKHIRDLRLHEVIHEEESSYRFACGDCPRKFYRIDLLRVHQANEKHFSQEVVGPCVTTKISEAQIKNIEPFESLPTTSTTARELGSLASTKRKRKQQQKLKSELTPKVKNRDSLYDCLGSPTLFPSMVAVDSIDDSSSALEIVELTPTLTSNAISSSLLRRNIQEIDTTDQSSFMLNTKDPVISNLLNVSNSSITIPVAASSNYPLVGANCGSGNSVYPIKDSDRGISAFNISAGAEQIGYDVINAFINNLN